MMLKTVANLGAELLFLGCLAVRPLDVQAGSLCTPPERIVFSCDLKNAKTVSLCEGPASRPQYLEYRFGKPSKVEMAFRATSAERNRVFHRADIVGANNAADSIWFKKNGYVYDISMPARGAPGVQVWKQGDMLANFECQGGWGASLGNGRTSLEFVVDHGSLDVSEAAELWNAN